MTPEQKLIFGQIPPKEAALRHRQLTAKAKKEFPPQDPYETFRVGKPLIEAALKSDWEFNQRLYSEKKRQAASVLKAVFGEKEIPLFISPSTAANCLRWVGYEDFSYHPRIPTIEALLIMMLGSAGHYDLLRKLSPHGSKELSFKVEELISGRIDFFFNNPKTGEDQLFELKFVSPFVYRKVQKKNGNYQPSPEHRKQVLLYLWAKRKGGSNVPCGDIIYIDRASGSVKESLVFWDKAAESETEIFVEEIKKAKELIDRGELPEPTVESAYICAQLCPYCLHCDFGQKYAAGKIKREQKRKPRWVVKAAIADQLQKKENMVKLGLVQPKLPELEAD